MFFNECRGIMSIAEMEDTDIGEWDLVPEVLYKASLNDKTAKHLWITLYDTLYNYCRMRPCGGCPSLG